MAMPTELDAVMSTLGGINYVELDIVFLLFFVFGYLLYASMFAAIGSAVENEADSQQLVLPLTIPLMIGFFIAMFAYKSPDSALVFWGSMIPFTSPMVMLTRVLFGVPILADCPFCRHTCTDLRALRMAFCQDIQGGNPYVRQEVDV